MIRSALLRPGFLLTWALVNAGITTGLAVTAQWDASSGLVTSEAAPPVIKADLTVRNPDLRQAADLDVSVTVTNKSNRALRLNTLFWDSATLRLEVRERRRRVLVNPGPPPVPPVDDGQTARIVLAPGRSLIYVYKGRDFFGTVPPPGAYQVRFRYENRVVQHGDWIGTIESPWVDFKVRR